MIVTKAILEKLIADNKITLVIDFLLALDVGDTQLRDKIVALSARFTQYKDDKHGNIELPTYLGVEINQTPLVSVFF